MSDDRDMPEAPEETPSHSTRISAKVPVLLVLVALFAGVVTAKTLGARQTTGAGGQAPDASLTSTHIDAMADYQAALKTGEPVYVLFHSLS